MRNGNTLHRYSMAKPELVIDVSRLLRCYLRIEQNIVMFIKI